MSVGTTQFEMASHPEGKGHVTICVEQSADLCKSILSQQFLVFHLQWYAFAQSLHFGRS